MLTRQLAAVLAVGTVVAVARAGTGLEYRLTVGSKLVYASTSSSTGPKGRRGAERRIEVWVTEQKADSSWHLVLKRESRGFQEDPEGKRSDGPVETEWAWCDLEPDGRIAENPSLDRVDISDLFFPLPGDTLEAKTGWSSAGELDEVTRYRLDNKNLKDTVWAIQFAHETPLDAVYEMTLTGMLMFNLRQGLPVQRETRSRMLGDQTSASETRLMRVERLDFVRLRPFLSELGAFFRAESAARQLEERADEDTAVRREMTGFALGLEALQSLATDTAVQGMFRQLAGDLKEYAVRAATDPARDSMLGRPAPGWQVTDLDGRTHKLGDFKGKVVLLDFWYRRCPWCIRAMPQVKELVKRFAGRPVQILGMNVDRDTNDARFSARVMELNYPTLLARGVPEDYGVSGYPTVCLIDRKGRIRKYHVGFAPDIGDRLARDIEELLAR